VNGLLTFVVAAISWIPRACLAAVGAGLARVARPLARKDLGHLRRNVHAVYGLPPGTHFSDLFERQVLRHHAICALETLRIIRRPELMTLAGGEELGREIGAAEAGGRGHIIVTAHLGSWELCAYLGRRFATQAFHVLAKPPRQAGAVTFLTRLRERMGVDVFWTDRKSLLRDMLGALKRGESVGFVMDQKPEGRKGPVVPFLGRPTEFVSGPAAMAARTGCAVIALFCVRTGPFAYRALARTLYPSGHGVTDETAMTGVMAAAIDEAVRLYPEQWVWNYKRWR
jgi:KDO2-lipid IV(A) lauroyltransferase